MGEILVLYYSRGGSVARLARQIVSHRLQNSIIKTTRLPVGNARVFGKSGLTE